VTAEGIAAEYLRLIEEGWTPDIEEFLHHVPEALREESRQCILELTAVPEQPTEPVVEAPVEVDLFAEPEVTGEVKEVVEAVDNPAPFDPLEEEPEPAPKLVKLSREEAKAMFAEMEAKAAAAS
jgi:hypothetical protein